MDKLIAYAYDFISYAMLQPIWKKYNLRQIILYGSAARGDYTKESDIDLFFDIMEDKKKANILEKEVTKIKKNFLLSSRIDKWKQLHVKNELSLLIGNLEEKKWIDLRRSLSFHGFLLWSRFIAVPKEKLNPYLLLKWKVEGRESKKRVALARKLYGYTQKKKRYPGMLEKFKAQSWGRGLAVIPAEHINHFRELMNRLKIKYNMKDVYF